MNEDKSLLIPCKSYPIYTANLIDYFKDIDKDEYEWTFSLNQKLLVDCFKTSKIIVMCRGDQWIITDEKGKFPFYEKMESLLQLKIYYLRRILRDIGYECSDIDIAIKMCEERNKCEDLVQADKTITLYTEVRIESICKFIASIVFSDKTKYIIESKNNGLIFRNRNELDEKYFIEKVDMDDVYQIVSEWAMKWIKKHNVDLGKYVGHFIKLDENGKSLGGYTLGEETFYEYPLNQKLTIDEWFYEDRIAAMSRAGIPTESQKQHEKLALIAKNKYMLKEYNPKQYLNPGVKYYGGHTLADIEGMNHKSKKGQ